jgi:hypothetical protein
MRTLRFTAAIVPYSTAPTNAHARVRPWMASAAMPASSAMRAMASALRAPGAGADLQRDRDVDRGHDGRHDARHQRLVAEQRGAGGGVADLLRRATHVDVDDLRAEVGVVARGIGEHRRIGARDLHGDRRHLACMIDAPARLRRVPQPRVRADHLRHGVAGAEALAELAEWPIGDTRHRCDSEGIRQGVGADAHRGNASRICNRRRCELYRDRLPALARSSGIF